MCNMEFMIKRLLENRRNVSPDTPDEQYRRYLDTHRKGVSDVFQETMLPILLEESVDSDTLDHIKFIIDTHDASKDDEVEFNAYRDHFYDPEKNPKSGSVEYDRAWNHHQKSNPHHWQYWCLINDVDEPQIQPLDMPLEYIVEMLCDWQSAGRHYGNTAFDWYQKQKGKMILSENTRKLVEKYIKYFK